MTARARRRSTALVQLTAEHIVAFLPTVRAPRGVCLTCGLPLTPDERVRTACDPAAVRRRGARLELTGPPP